MKPRPKVTKSKTNTALRQWARGISFTIAMGRRQVFTLISLHLSAEHKHGTLLVGDRHRIMSHFIISTHCLVDRGLVIAHVWNDEKLQGQGAADRTYKELWSLTRAGELVIELLKEAGIYEEVKAELEAANQLKVRIA